MIGALRTLVHGVADSVLGVPIVVRRPAPDEAPVTTSGIWLRSPDEPLPTGTDFHRRQPRRVLSIPLSSDMSSIPRETRISATDRDEGVTVEWRVVELLKMEVDRARVFVVPVATS